MPHPPTTVSVRRSLRFRLPFVIVSLVAALLGTFVWASYRIVEETLDQSGRERAQRSAAAVARLVESQLSTRAVQRIADEPAIRRVLEDPTSESLDAARIRLTAIATPGPRRIEIWNRNGSRVLEASMPGPSAALGPNTTMPLFVRPPSHAGIQPLSADGPLVFSDVVADIRDEERKGAERLGSLVVRSTFTLNPPGVIRDVVGPNTIVAIGNRTGDTWTDLSHAIPGPRSDRPHSETSTYNSRNRERRVDALVDIGGTPWVVWVDVPALQARSPLVLNEMLVVLVVCLIGGALLTRVIVTRVVTPIADLQTASAAIASGDYSRRVTTQRSDEIGALAGAFNTMIDHVDEARRDLEIRVEDRTRALNEALAAVRKRSEAQDAFLAAIVDGSADAVIGQTLDLTIQSVNAAAERLYGYTAAELIGHSSLRIIPADRQGDVDAVIARVRRGERIRDLETIRLAKDGTQVPVSVTISPIADATGTIFGLASVARDLRERRLLEEQLRQAQKMEAIGQLAGGVAHDFNNLLTAILGYAQFAFEELGPDHPVRTDLEEIVKAGERAAGLTKQLLAFSRKQVVQPVLVNLNTLVTETSKMLQRLIGEHIRLDTTLVTDIGLVRADPGQLDQILMNLSVNARDAMPTGGRLTIETANVSLDASFVARHGPVRPGPYVMLAITDTGVGMTAQTRARLFEPFFTTKEPGKGTGLGLATVYGIVKQNDGHLYVYSEPGRGATFKIYLPRVDAADTVKSQTQESPTIGGTETVLLVEDERAVRILARTMLEGAGYRVIEAGGPSDVDAALDEQGSGADILVTDVIMPGSNGPALFRRLSEVNPKLRVLYVSGYTDDAVFREGQLEAGAAFLQKPFAAAELLRKVRQVLDTSRPDSTPKES